MSGHTWVPDFRHVPAWNDQPERIELDGWRCSKCGRRTTRTPYLVGPYQGSPLRETRRFPACKPDPKHKPEVSA